MSTINTNSINVNYPVPGVNNNSQGFRDNFAAIKTNLNTAGSEITDLQNKVVLKSALANSTINNDMNNTLISNALTRSFRASTYNLGGAISGTVVVNASLGDVQYGTIAGDTTIQFAGWAPTGTQSNVQLQLTIANTTAAKEAVITFPAAVNNGITSLENYANVANVPTVTIPYGVTQLDYNFSTVDCGNSITVEPYNNSRIASQIQTRNVTPTGYEGDVVGDIAISTGVDQLSITSSNASDYLNTADTVQLYTDMPIVFTGVSMEANITVGTTYYVRNVSANTYFTVSSTIGGANVNLAGNSSPTSPMYANPVSYMYVCTDDYNSTAYEKSATATNSSGNITLNNTTSLANNAPIVFTGTTFGGLVANTVYYIKSGTFNASPGNIIVSQSRTNGVADTAVTLTTASGNACVATAYVGSDIWKRIALTSW
jgi:hypothetical protein